jgi:hypothetical protein
VRRAGDGAQSVMTMAERGTVARSLLDVEEGEKRSKRGKASRVGVVGATCPSSRGEGVVATTVVHCDESERTEKERKRESEADKWIRPKIQINSN